MLNANACPGTNIITFSIAGAGPHTIQPLSALPTITDTVTLDGWSEPDFSGAPVVVIRGSSAGAVNGLVIAAGAPSSTVRGLVIRDFNQNGLLIQADNSIIVGNYIGLAADGTTLAGNNTSATLLYGGVRVESANNLIGGLTAVERNVISGNFNSGLVLHGVGATGNQIRGNYIGTDAGGALDRGNDQEGIEVFGATSNLIGGTAAGARNVISGNGSDAIEIDNGDANVVQGNYLGADYTGVNALGNDRDGVDLNENLGDGATGNLIGGTNPGEGNLVFGNGMNGVEVRDGPTSGNRILGNQIYGNGLLGIDLAANGVTANDGTRSAGQPNLLMDYPVFTSVVISGTTLTVSGYIGTAPADIDFANTRVEVFESDNDGSGYGEGLRYLGALTTTTTGDFGGTLTVSGLVAGERVTGTATDPSNNTSEFGPNFIAVAPFVVNVTTDAPDANTGDGLCQTAGVGECSLRAAIQQANATAGANAILFNIPGVGPHTIAPTSALPAITGPVTIDGYSQPGASANTLAIGNDAVLKIELNGAGAGAGVDGLNLGAGSDGSALRGLVINRFLGDGISGSADNVTIAGNYIGTDAAGTADLGNGVNGINADGDNWTIGGLTTAGRNLVSGNNDNGIQLFGDGHTVLGNYVGTNAAGSAAIGNSDEGIEMASNSSGNTIGGTAAGAGNVASGNGDNGILIYDSQGNTVLGNYVGVNAAGTAAIGNGDDGIEVNANSLSNTIGGTAAGAGNVASGNGDNGLYVGGGTANTLIVGNYIGVAATGVTAIGNGSEGLEVNDASDTVIGGTQPGAGNVIGANAQEGIWIINGATGTVVQGNWIGTDKTGTINLGNSNAGIRIGNTIGVPANNNLIGGSALGVGNVIAFNSEAGVAVDTNIGPSVNNAILGNSIYANTGLGIDLDDLYSSPPSNGVTPNDGAGDPDTGGNNRQNFPVLTSAATTGSTLNVGGALTSTASTQFRIEFFANVTADPTGYGEGQRYLGAYTVTTSAGGVTPFITTLTTTVATTETVTATATDPNGNTSEFGPNVSVTIPLVVNNTGDAVDSNIGNGVCATAGGVCTLRAAIQEANALAGANTINFSIAGAGPHIIAPSSALPAISSPVLVDGASEPDFFTNGNRPIVVLAGTNAGFTDTGLVLAAGSSGSTIRGLLIRHWGGDAIEIQAGSSNNLIVGNYLGRLTHIGTDSGVGTENAWEGITIYGANNMIGGLTPADRNVISGNGDGGFWIEGASATGNRIIGNYIGVAADGTTALANGASGIYFLGGASNNIVGGVTPADRNVISGNAGDGIAIDSSNNMIQGNYIGVAADGSSALGNGDAGVFITNSSDHTIGGSVAGAGNVIANNADGVAITGGGVASIRNRILGNSIYANVFLGIDLGNDGVTANDGSGDPDSGPNNLQNFPVLTSAVTTGSQITVTGGLTSAASTQFRIEFFANLTADPSGYGEGQRYLGAYTTTTSAGGVVSFSATLTATVATTETVSATAADPNGNTSEFGPNVAVTYPFVTREPTASTDCVQVDHAAGTAAWTLPGNAYRTDNTYATASVDGTTSEYLYCRNFGFALPAGATIQGIVIDVERKSNSTSNGGSRDASVRLVNAAGTVVGNDNATTTLYTTSDLVEAHGSSGDLWGVSWAVADINDPDFGVVFAATKPSSAGAAHTVTVDHIRVTVYYSP
jgi:CSLREA domain-containing protein